MRRRVEAVQARHNRILDLLADHEFLTVRELSAMLQISEVTIRRDLETLDAQGRLNRRHGGASRHNERAPAVASEKREATPGALIASRALELIEPGNVILLSAGPISEEIARRLLSRRDVTVITNSVAVFDILRENEHIHLVATGGELRRTHSTLVGPLAEASVREVRVDKLFLEPSGISRAYQLYHSSIPDVSMQQVMIQAAREVIVVAEPSIFGREGIMQVASIRVANKLILDGETPDRIRTELESEGVDIVTAQE